MTATARDLEREMRLLTVGTNDQRRRVGQTLFHFYKTLIFWKETDVGFAAITRMWSAGGGMVFDALAASMRDLGDPGRDEPLRSYTAEFLVQLAEDLARGDHMLLSYLRWLEERFPELTAMMQEESSSSRIYDVELAEILAALFVHCASAEPEGLPRVFKAAAAELAKPA